MDHSSPHTDRRTILRLTSSCLASGVVLGATGEPARGEDGESSITFEDQSSDGRSIVITRATTSVEAFIMVQDSDRNFIVSDPSHRINLEAGETIEDAELVFPEPLSEGQELTAVLQESNGGTLDEDSAFVSLSGELPERIDGVEPRLVEADSDAGFNYPYYLYAPDTFEDESAKPLLVEPTNSGTATDQFEEHRAAGERTITSGYGRGIADQLNAPFVVPVFPRPRSDPVDGTHYVHQLDDTTMSIDQGPLQRVDLQLLSMVDDARRRLANRGYPTAEGIMLNGFSASGNFVDRFTVLHPERVLSVTAGGLNGMAILPLEQAEGQTLPYHVGIADVEELTGSPVDLAALDEVNQFLYMGAEDTNDTIPYTDAWTDEELRELALDVYGEDMITERFPRCQEAYEEAGLEAQFRVYEDTGHSPRPAKEDVVAVHQRTIDGESVDDLGQTLTATLQFEVTPEAPAAGTSTEFTAAGSAGGMSEITHYLWDFGNGATAVGETVTHTFDEPGEYTITLTTILDDGTEKELTETVTIRDENGDDVSGRSPTETASATSEATVGEDGPGFGVGSSLAGLCGAGWMLKQRLVSEPTSEE